jgi:hypothetical protein
VPQCLDTKHSAPGTAANNVVGASARLRRAPEYTAPKPCGARERSGEVRRRMTDGHSCLAPRRQPPNVMRQRLYTFAGLAKMNLRLRNRSM